MLIELVCKAEGAVVAKIDTAGGLRAMDLINGVVKGSADLTRMPAATSITDGTQMRCKRCSSSLYFRGSDGELIPANPGNFKAEV